MAILFYDHLIIKTEIITYIDSLEVPDNQKGKTKQLIDDIIHQSIIKLILDNLDPVHHTKFLTQVDERPYDPELLSFIKEHGREDIEDLIRQESNKLIKMIQKDLNK